MSGHAALSVYGRLTSDPRIIETRTGTAMTAGRLAVALPCRENGEDGEATLWIGIVAWGELAESLAKHVKGDMVSASGRLKINRYTNRDGEAKEELNILADGLVSARTIRPGGAQKRKPSTPATSPPDPLPSTGPEPTEPPPVPEGPITDDDIPF